MRQSRQHGIGLVEIMISLTLGLLVTGAVVQIYLTTKRQNDMQTSLTGRQESARFAAQIIQRDAQMAGFRGCLRDIGAVANTLNTPTNFLYNYGQHVVGFDNAAGLPASITNVVAGTDVLTLRTVDDPGIVHAGDGHQFADPVVAAGLAPGRWRMRTSRSWRTARAPPYSRSTKYNAVTGAIEHVVAARLSPRPRSASCPYRHRTSISFSFHVPSVGFGLAKHIAPAAIESSRVKPIVFVFISDCRDKRRIGQLRFMR